MEKRPVLLVCLQPLLGDGLQQIFQRLEDVELRCLEGADLHAIHTCLAEFKPEMVLLAGESEDDAATHLIYDLLKHCEDIPIIWIELETNILRLYTSHFVKASSADLITAIREHQTQRVEICLMDQAGRGCMARPQKTGKGSKRKYRTES